MSCTAGKNCLFGNNDKPPVSDKNAVQGSRVTCFCPTDEKQRDIIKENMMRLAEKWAQETFRSITRNTQIGGFIVNTTD